MAAEMVLLENLERTLVSREIQALTPLTREVNTLRGLVRRSQGPFIALESGDYVHDDIMRSRLENLSTSLHQVDDLLDQILTFQHRGEVCVLLQSPKQFVFHRLMARRVEKISNYIENLVGQLLNELEYTNQPNQRELQPMGWFIPAEHKLIGRDNDKKKIINMLLQTPKDGKSNVSIISLSGVTGVGKSALAKDIYEDHKVRTHFDLRMWIPVSQITDETEIIREIVESCTNRRSNYSDNSQSAHYHNSRVHQNDGNSFLDLLGCRSSSIATGVHDNNINAYQNLENETDKYERRLKNEIDIYERRLKNEIRGKRYLLVLDDVCLQKWQRLRDLLDGGAEGSLILVTSRLPKVADLANSGTSKIKGLTKEHSWTLFNRIAFKKDGIFSAEMKEIGFEISEMCNHLPFTVKVAASFIHGKNTKEWLDFKKELRLIKDQKEDIMEHVLHLSLSDLPTHLRACFGYCSLFPDDFTFNKHDLISLWIAQGFVYPQDDLSLEEVGEMYFKELSRRCFVEKESTDYLGNIITCKMHHIVRNLALKLKAGVANIHVIDSWIRVADQTLKHIFVNCRGDLSSKLSSPLLQFPGLRTLILVKKPDCDIKTDTLVFNQLISSYNTLRVLDLHDLGLRQLPDSIGEQIHLRYLDLSKNDCLVSLPKSLTRLHNLQTLKLNSCRKLKALPSDFGLLINLQRLEVDECDRLTCMPLGLQKLTQLETLSHFTVGKGSSKQTTCAGLEALSGLTMLRGRLAIKFTRDWMPNVREDNPGEVTGGWMRNVSKLRELNIRWAQKISDVKSPSGKEIIAQEEILEHLQPNPSLKILCVEGYKGGNFPSWARADKLATSLPNLVTLIIEGCGKCEFLPPFGELANLRKLTLRHMTNVRYVEEPSQGSNEGRQDHPLFKSLEALTLHNFYELEGWRKELSRLKQPETQTFPHLSKLRIWNCPNLRWLPSFPKVTKLKLRNVHQLLLDDCARKASSHQNRLGIEGLQIRGGLNVEGLGGRPSLKHLVIENCDALVSLASDLKNFTSLETLKISTCKEVDLFQESHSIYVVFRNSPWRKLKCLSELTLIDIPKMKVLPEGLKYVKTLNMLRLSACESLESLPEWINCLTALQNLRIESCGSLKRLPQELKNVKSLLKVEITDCPELMERCREKGEDWPNIKHARVLLHKSWRYGYVS